MTTNQPEGETAKKSDLQLTEELFEFLQGVCPADCKIAKSHMPKLTADQAETVIWYLGNQYWQVSDHVHRCCVCGNFFDKDNSGDCLDYGKPPIFFCDSCIHSEAYVRKMRRNPDKQERESYFA